VGAVDESDESFGSALTANDGTFRFVGMKEVPYTIVVFRASDGWIAAAAEGARGKTGELTRVPDLVFTGGRARGGDGPRQRTGKPLARVLHQQL